MSTPRNLSLTRGSALVLAGGIAIVAAFWSHSTHPEIYAGRRSDFAMLHAAASAFLAGHDPYSYIGPGRAYELAFPLIYPFTAVLTALPFTWMPFPDALFVALGAGLFGWAIVSRRRYRWALFGLLTPAFIYTMQMSQWSALLTGAALVPGWGFLLACKPTIGAALFAAYPSRRTLWGCGVFLGLSLVLLPSWPSAWLANLPAATHTRAPVTFWGGPLILLALLRWRDPEARLLVAMACVPHTTELYESLPLCLIPSSGAQGALLAALNWGVVIARGPAAPASEYVRDMALTGQWMVWLLYLPCLAMVLLKRRGANDVEPGLHDGRLRPNCDPAGPTVL